MPPQTIAVIIVAAGKGERARHDAEDPPKQYRPIVGRAVLARTIEAFLAHPAIGPIVPIIHPDHDHYYRALAPVCASPERLKEHLLPPVAGGATRQASVRNGLAALAPLAPDLVLIHDGARPFVSPRMIEAVLAALETAQGALPALPLTDTLKRTPDGRTVAGTEDRRFLAAAQTPQGFRFAPIRAAHERAATTDRAFTDDAEIAEWAGLDVVMVEGERDNIKITHPDDFTRGARIMLKDLTLETRIGSGFDVHPFAPGNAVWLCGVEIPHTARLKGHSDADVALHALTDALLGAIGEGDIGVHFPPSDPQWRGAASTLFLAHAGKLVAARNGRIVNIDVTIVCEAPRITQYVPAMRQVIAETLTIAPGRVAIKATTNEKLGFIGREEGMVAMASASVELPRAD